MLKALGFCKGMRHLMAASQVKSVPMVLHAIDFLDTIHN